MNIAVIGIGNVGGVLAARWKDLGHRVTLGVRDPMSEKARDAASRLALPAATPAEAAQDADLVLLAVPGETVVEAAVGCGDLTGKIVMDATNPLLPGLAGLDHPGGLSAGERVARAIPAARVVKAFNTVGANIMANPVLDGRATVLFLSGDDKGAIATVSDLARATGFDPVVLGGINMSRMQEENALLWIHLAYKGGLGRQFAFCLVREGASS